MTELLPRGFEALEPFVAAWAIPGTAARAQRRVDSTEAERVAFYSAAKDLVPLALSHLDRKPVTALDPQERRLLDLLLTLAHISLAVEVQGDQEAVQALGRQQMKITRSTAG